MNNRRRYGLLTAAALIGAIIVPMQVSAQAARPAVMQALLRDIAGVEQKTVALAEAIPEQAFAWQPSEGTRTVAEVLVHIAADNYFLPTVAGTAAPAATGIVPASYESVQAYERRSMTKAEAIAAVKASFAHLRTAMEKTDDAFLANRMNLFGSEVAGVDLWVMTTTHLHEHLGQLIAYARSNNVVPPWSR